jgi:DNA anti-recombination protein RmuC
MTTTALLVLVAFGGGLAVGLALLALRHRGTAAVGAADGELQAALDRVVALAGERLAAQTAQASGSLEAAGARIDAQLGSLGAELQRVTSVVQSLEVGRERQYGALAEQLAATGRASADLAETTRQLREALASRTARGQWGERMAEDVLRVAGFVEGVSTASSAPWPAAASPTSPSSCPRGARSAWT